MKIDSESKLEEMTEALEQVSSIIRVGTLCMEADSGNPLTNEEIMNIFNAITKLVKPVKDALYSIHWIIDEEQEQAKAAYLKSQHEKEKLQ